MLSLNMVYHALQGQILSADLPCESTVFQSFRMLDMESPFLHKEDLLYLATPGSFCAIADHMEISDGRCFTFLISGDSPSLIPYQNRNGIQLIITSLSLSALCNRLIEVEHTYDKWVSSMESHLYETPDLYGLISNGATILSADIFVLDEKYELITAARCANCPIFDPLEKDRRFAYDSLLIQPTSGWHRLEQWYVSLSPILTKEHVAGYLLLALPEAQKEAFTEELAKMTVQYISRFLHRHYLEKYDSISRLTVLISDIIEGRLTDQDSLVERVKQLPIQLQRYYCVIVVEPDEPRSPLVPYLTSGLAQLFPLGIIVPYREDILVLAQKTRYESPLEYDREKLSRLLEQYQAVACVSNLTKWLNALRPLYLQTKGCIPYARHFRTDSTTRLFRFEEYSMYQIVDLCARYCQDFHHNDLIYLSHPGIVALRKYDDTHSTNYCLILKQYILNDRNQSQTAKKFFYHRNTLQNKLAKIEAIVKDDLENPCIRQRLIFSLLVVDYMRVYLKQTDIYGLKRYHPATSKLIDERP